MRTFCFLIGALVFFSACSSGDPEPKVYPDPFAKAAQPLSHVVMGVVKSVRSEGRVLVVDHEDIPGFMEAMTMPFTVEDPDLTKSLKPGDKIEFTIEEKGGDWPITKLEKASGH
ncbi:MAG: hypothetical protein COB53_07340 [Elusimicrobia bacterium]|nr:MAG: hypothetical protein COB53_07340 [Elusimicrobiota bacterium]